MARLFVAVTPPPEVLDLVEDLPRPAESGVRYSVRDQWHVTLRFLGSADVATAATALGQVSHPPVEARLGPRVSRLGRNVVVVPVAGLESLASAVVGATRDVGEPPDPRPFTGHLTVARLKRRGACRIAGSPIDATFPVGEVELFGSRLDADRARYERLAVQTLA